MALYARLEYVGQSAAYDAGVLIQTGIRRITPLHRLELTIYTQASTRAETKHRIPVHSRLPATTLLIPSCYFESGLQASESRPVYPLRTRSCPIPPQSFSAASDP